ncbi:MAG: DUF362 domain-containing protein [Desulfobacterota bacterium]|nr:DUF362 domain-containing protein [Thermodesulfobacteriota bacterium]
MILHYARHIDAGAARIATAHDGWSNIMTMPIVTVRTITENLKQELAALLEPFAQHLILSGRSVLIKPNLVEPEPWTSGQTTNPALVEALVQWCRAQGASRIAIGEGPSYFQPASDLEACFTKTGIADVARRQHIEWILFDKDSYRTFSHHSPNTPSQFSVSEHAFRWDHIINVPVPKPHYLTTVSIAMKNLKGFIKREHKPLFHHAGKLGIHGSVTDLNLLVRPSLNIVDGTAGIHNNKQFLLAGTDIVAVDAVTAALMGFNPQEIGTIRLGAAAGLGQMDLTAITIIGSHITELRINIEQPLDFLRKEFPGITLQAAQACSGCLIPLFAALRRLCGQNIRPYRPLTLALGIQPSPVSGAVCIGRCATPADQKQTMWLHACPPSQNEVFDFLRSCFGHR